MPLIGFPRSCEVIAWSSQDEEKSDALLTAVSKGPVAEGEPNPLIQAGWDSIDTIDAGIIAMNCQSCDRAASVCDIGKYVLQMRPGPSNQPL